MNSLTVVVLCAAFAAANAGILRGALIGPAVEGAVIQGPGSVATVNGPDGSVIASNQPGGTVVASARTGVVAAGIGPGVVAHAAPYAAPLLARGPAVVAHHGAVLAGAPGLIAGAPGLIAGAPGVIAARAGLLAGPLVRGYPALAPGSGLEGQYLHDYTETLYDNGQYHGEIYP